MQRGAISKLVHNRWVQFSALVTGVFTCIGIVTDGYTYWGWLQANWRNIYQAVNHPWFYWMIPMAFGMLFWFGVRQIARAERDAEAKTVTDSAERQAREVAAQRRLIRLPYLMTKAFVHSQEVFTLEREIGQLRRQLESITRQLAPWLGDDRIEIRHHLDDPIRVEYHFNLPSVLHFQATSFEVPSWYPHWTKVDSVITTEAAPQPHQRGQRYFDPLANRASSGSAGKS